MKKNRILLTAAILLCVVAMFQLSVGAAVDFRPSIELKPAPAVDTTDVKVVDAAGNVVGDAGELIVTPISTADEADTKLSANIASLKEGFNQLKAAAAITDVVPETALKAIADAENVALPAIQNLVVTNVFDVWFENAQLLNGTATASAAKNATLSVVPAMNVLANSGNSVSLTFKSVVNADEFHAVLFKPVDGDWSVVPASDFSTNAAGDVTVKFTELGAVAFLVEADAADTTTVAGGAVSDTTAPASTDKTPQTGLDDAGTITMWSAAVVLAAALVVVTVVVRKRSVSK